MRRPRDLSPLVLAPLAAGRRPGAYELHVSRQARELLGLDESLFSLSGSVLFADFAAARRFAARLDAARDALRFPERAVGAARIYAAGLIHEILHYLVARYRELDDPQAMARALSWLDQRLGAERVDQALATFVEEFPPLAVHRGEVAPEAYLRAATEGIRNREILLEELLLLWLMNQNPALEELKEVFDDAVLERRTLYPEMMAGLEELFAPQDGEPGLIDRLRGPAAAVPGSLGGQLGWLRQEWPEAVAPAIDRVLRGTDFLREAEQPRFAPGAGPALAPSLEELAGEPEQFTPDRDWMPRLVLLAKNTYVWLDQLSKAHGSEISRLDQVPDAELDEIAGRGVTGLWLIGLWERSRASARIKRLTGNPEAVASAYSLYDYQVAEDLGGEEACEELKRRAWRRGIRLASDMVPNHMGIDSRWVVEHPERFISLPESPFAVYTFDGPDLSSDPAVGIYLEDHYYQRSDAAVVFQRVDRESGEVRYVYHGNDGTSTPWNDTAQLDYLEPEVREAMIELILEVARKFPIVRFDAAMTLARRHFQRLWYPAPGTGGDIPSRAEHGLTPEELERRMPQELWREVVDRAAVEAPDTLLLAEAFWLMEGYFVRTLGMHRVYNSAFMNMLRDERNAEYRELVAKTLAFDPEILKRYVNFMSNPDERTALEQFGAGDKYFGVCTLLATLPGLPMLGHGQVEGFAEKYGMEYRRAHHDERPDSYLAARHARQIFPLFHRRYLFAEAEHFRLFDFERLSGTVDEDVFAYSNRAETERALVVYHNRPGHARGCLRLSVPYRVRRGEDEESGEDEPLLGRETLAGALGLTGGERRFLLYRDLVTGLEHLRPVAELADVGLALDLGPYECHVWVDLREVEDDARGRWARLADGLAGRGVASLEEAELEIQLAPVHTPFTALVAPETFRRLRDGRPAGPDEVPDEPMLEETEALLAALLAAAAREAGSAGDLSAPLAAVRRRLATALALFAPVEPGEGEAPAASSLLAAGPRGLAPEEPAVWGPLMTWILVAPLGEIGGNGEPRELARGRFEDWRLGKLTAAALSASGVETGAAARQVDLVEALLAHASPLAAAEASGRSQGELLAPWLADEAARRFLGVNRYDGVLWLNRECFEELVWWWLACVVIEDGADRERLAAADLLAHRLLQWAEAAGYRVEELLATPPEEATSTTAKDPASAPVAGSPDDLPTAAG